MCECVYVRVCACVCVVLQFFLQGLIIIITQLSLIIIINNAEQNINKTN